MQKRWIMLLLIATLAGCGDPLAGIERVSEMENIPVDAAANAVSTEEELNRDTPIFAALFGGSGEAAATDSNDGNDAPVVSAKAVDEPGKAPGGSLFRNVKSNGPDAQDVPFGTVLPFGQIARVCDAKGRKLGKLVEQAARRGAGYKLYDTAPNSVSPRTFYVKGFKDNCPRQFTASLALFGTPELHEQLRYGLPAKAYPYSATDKAYETVKTQECNVSKSKPCGRRISRLERTTVFVSAYENFSGNARWADMLIHKGVVLAASLKTP